MTFAPLQGLLLESERNASLAVSAEKSRAASAVASLNDEMGRSYKALTLDANKLFKQSLASYNVAKKLNPVAPPSPRQSLAALKAPPSPLHPSHRHKMSPSLRQLSMEGSTPHLSANNLRPVSLPTQPQSPSQLSPRAPANPASARPARRPTASVQSSLPL